MPRTSRTAILSRPVNLFRRCPFVWVFFIYIDLVAIIAGVALMYYNRDTRHAYKQIPYNQTGIALIGHGYLLELTNQVLSVEWEIMGCGGYRLPRFPWADARGCNVCDRAVDIYFNGEPEPSFSYDPAKIPLGLGNEMTHVYDLSAFVVDHPLRKLAQDMAPFDTYSLTAIVFVIEKDTNKSVPIISFGAGEGPKNFVVSSKNSRTLSNYTYDSGTGPTTVEVESSVISVAVKRSQLAQAFTVCLLLINSALTVGSAYVTVLVLTERQRIHEGIFLFPVTVVLTIPALRSLYPGGPPFGIYIDTFGFFSQMTIVALCSMILLYVIASPSAPVRRASHGGGNT